MKNLIIFLNALVLVHFSYGQYDPEAKAVLDAMSDNYKKIEAYSVSFTQKLSNEAADIEESVDGIVTVKGNMYKLEIANQEIYNDGEYLWTYNKEINEVTVAEFMADEQEISLNNIWDLYKDGFKYILLSTNPNGSKVIDLDPTDRSKSFFKVRMVISKDNELFSFTVFETNGNKYRYTLLNFTERPNLPDEFFSFDPADYPDVEVIDFR